MTHSLLHKSRGTRYLFHLLILLGNVYRDFNQHHAGRIIAEPFDLEIVHAAKPHVQDQQLGR